MRGSDAESKLVKLLESRGYSTEISKSPKLYAIPYDMEDEKLGLGDELYKKLQSEVSIVLHNAWRLDFNRPVDMYEADCISGKRITHPRFGKEHGQVNLNRDYKPPQLLLVRSQEDFCFHQQYFSRHGPRNERPEDTRGARHQRPTLCFWNRLRAVKIYD